MKKILLSFLLVLGLNSFSQTIEISPLLEDEISIRAIEVFDNKVWYAGSESKFGFVDLKNTKNKKQIKLSDKNLQFRTLSQDSKSFFAINIESPAYFFEVDKKTLQSKIIFTDTVKTAFYDALHFNGDNLYTFSDPMTDLKLRFLKFKTKGKAFKFKFYNQVNLKEAEAAFAASNSNISSTKKNLWIATGGKASRIIKMNLKTEAFEVFSTPFIQGTSSQGIYAIDFADDYFGIAVGGDYTMQKNNVNNIATTNDGGKTWQIQASGKNAGYTTVVKIKPNTQGEEIIAVGDQHISYSKDYGKTWTILSEEKGFYTATWVNDQTVVLAGKDKISLLNFK